jgi:hypothetical protein
MNSFDPAFSFRDGANSLSPAPLKREQICFNKLLLQKRIPTAIQARYC